MANNPSNSNLDLTQVESDDFDQLAQKIETFYKSDSAVKTQLAYHWERNHLMLDGKQWIVYDETGSGGVWKQLRVSKANEYIPRPVTNYLYDVYQTLKSYLTKEKPRSSVTPNTQLYKDKQAAKISSLILECNWERLKENQNYEYAAACCIAYGTVFKKSFWDTSALQSASVPKMQQVPTTDPTTGQQMGVSEMPVLDEFGQPVFEDIPLGDVNTEVVEPYRITLDPLTRDLHNARWIMESRIEAIDAVKDEYGKEEPGYTGLAGELKPETSLPGAMKRFFNLKNSSGTRTGEFTGTEGSAGENMVENAVVVKEYYERPTRKYPKGRLIVVANNKCLYSSDSPYDGPEQGDWHPYSECRWEVVPGRFWGKSPLDDVVEIQKQINSMDSIIILTRKTMAIPQRLIPLSAGIQTGSWTGRPGQEIPYRDSGTGAKPELIPPVGVDQTVFQERSSRAEDIKQISGAVDILKGDRPPGVTAASAINMLYEVGTGKLFPVLGRWKTFVEGDQKKQLRLVSQKYKEPRPDFIRLMKARNSELSEEMIDKFIGADLEDNCNVIVEAGSNVPKLQAAKQAALQEAAQVGTLSLDLPANRMEYNRQMGIVGFDNDIGPDVKRAEWENDLLDNIANSPDNRPVVLEVDDHDVHMAVVAGRMKEPSFVSLPPGTQQAFMQHWMEHEQKKQEAQQMQEMQAMMKGQPPQPPAPGANAPSPARGQGKGVPASMQKALASDALVPGKVGGK